MNSTPVSRSPTSRYSAVSTPREFTKMLLERKRLRKKIMDLEKELVETECEVAEMNVKIKAYIDEMDELSE